MINLKKILNDKTAKNASWLIGAKVAQMLISLLVGILTTRFLGPSNYGLINYGNAYTAFFLSFCTLGINSILVKEFTDKTYDEGTIIGTTLVLRAISSICSVGVIFCVVSLVDADETTTIIVTLLCSIGLLFNIFEVFNYWFQSKLQSKVTAIASFIAYTLASVYKLILLFLKKDVVWFAFATSIDYICLAICLVICYGKYKGNTLKFSSSCGKHLLKRSYHFILPSMMVSIYGYVDKFMLKQMINDAEIGYYSTAVSVCSMWCFVLSAIIDSLYPSIMEYYKKDYSLYEKRNKQLYAIVFYISIVVSILFTLFGKYVLLILYGEKYLPAAAPLSVITWYTAFSYLGVARNAWIVCEDKQKYLKYIYLSAAFSNVLLNCIFIPLWGATGAAAASLLTQIITIMVVPGMIKPLRRNTTLMIEAFLLKGVFNNREK